MTTTQLRNNLHKLIDNISDKNVLNAVTTILHQNDEIVGYTLSGEPLSLKEFQKRVKSASERVKAGKYVSHDDVKSEVAKWRKKRN